MDFTSPPARITTARPAGAFATGDALSMTGSAEAARPRDGEGDPPRHHAQDHRDRAGREVQCLDVRRQVPGPVVRARVGDRVKFTMSNRTDEPVPGVRMTAAPMMHSMDFHSAMVSPQDKYRSIAPGQTISFEFTLNYPGVFMYHCGTPMVLEHIASGMYGMMIVEPRGGYPTKVDREYADHPKRVLHQARSAQAQGRRPAAPRARRRPRARQGAHLHGVQRPPQRHGRQARWKPSPASVCASS